MRHLSGVVLSGDLFAKKTERRSPGLLEYRKEVLARYLVDIILVKALEGKLDAFTFVPHEVLEAVDPFLLGDGLAV